MPRMDWQTGTRANIGSLDALVLRENRCQGLMKPIGVIE